MACQGYTVAWWRTARGVLQTYCSRSSFFITLAISSMRLENLWAECFFKNCCSSPPCLANKWTGWHCCSQVVQTFPVQTVHARSHVSVLGAGEESGVSLFGLGNRFFSKAVNLLVFSERLVYRQGTNAVSVHSVLKALWGRGEWAAQPQHHIHPFDTSRTHLKMYSLSLLSQSVGYCTPLFSL